MPTQRVAGLDELRRIAGASGAAARQPAAGATHRCCPGRVRHALPGRAACGVGRHLLLVPLDGLQVLQAGEQGRAGRGGGEGQGAAVPGEEGGRGGCGQVRSQPATYPRLLSPKWLQATPTPDHHHTLIRHLHWRLTRAGSRKAAMIDSTASCSTSRLSPTSVCPLKARLAARRCSRSACCCASVPSMALALCRACRAGQGSRGMGSGRATREGSRSAVHPHDRRLDSRALRNAK